MRFIFINILVSFGMLYGVIQQDFGEIIYNDKNYKDPFLGGFNKPKIQWIDWDNDLDDDVFILDEDGCIQYYQNNGYIEDNMNFKLVTTSFENIKDINWFYFSDFDLDNDYDLVTQDPHNLEALKYYENTNNVYIDIGNILDNNNEIISIQSVMTPTFADIDFDGDLDFFVGNVVGTVSYYENIGLDNNKPVLEYVTNYWEEIYIVGSSLSQRHGASAISFIDLDNDEDLDLTWGDYFQQSLYVIYNLGTNTFPAMDNENILNQYPLENPVITAGLNMPTFSDIDSDGDQDLFVTVMSGAYGYQLTNNFYFYENVSNNDISEFNQITNNFLETLDLLSDINPEFFDYDNDNDLDLLIGTDFDPSSFPWTGTLVLFENIGFDENQEPIWSLVDNSYLDVDSGNNLSPSTIDIDADGDLDLFVGNFNGTLSFYENQGSSDQANYSYNGYVDNIDISGYSVPEFIDIDNDLDYDLLLGDMNGYINFFENIGDRYNPSFLLQDSQFQGINVQYRSSPLSYDYDNDGDLDLFVGSGYNDLFYYENIGELDNPYFSVNTENSFLNIGNNISPSLYSDLSNQGLILGLSTGGMYYIPICNNDINNDNHINIIDIVFMVLYIIGDLSISINEGCLDLNNDQDINILDVLLLIDYIFDNQ